MLPHAARYRTSQSAVATSTAPWYRLPPHTSLHRQTHERLYGTAPWASSADSQEVRAASAKLPPPPWLKRELLLVQKKAAAEEATRTASTPSRALLSQNRSFRELRGAITLSSLAS